MNLTGLLHYITGNLLYPLLENDSGVGELHLHALLPPRLGELQHPAIFVRLSDSTVCGLTAPRHLGLGISTRSTFIGELACDGFGEGFGGAAHSALEVELGAELAYFCESEGEVVHDGGEGIVVERGSGGFVGEEEMGGITKGIREEVGVVIKLPWKRGIGGHYCHDGWGPIWTQRERERMHGKWS